MKIQEVIKQLKVIDYKGFQIEKRFGIISSTWLIYKVGEDYYLFNIDDDIVFIEENKFTEDELISKFNGFNFEIDMPIN